MGSRPRSIALPFSRVVRCGGAWPHWGELLSDAFRVAQENLVRGRASVVRERVRRSRAGTLVLEPTTKKGDGGDRPTILVVDDDAGIREALAEILLLDGYAVVVACDGVAALELLHSGLRPSVIVLDLMMPRMDGWTFLSRLRLEERSTVPVLVASSSAPPHPAGADLCLDKPVETGALEAAIHAMCRGHWAEPSP